MKASQEMMNRAGVKPKLVLFQKDDKGVPRATGPHTVTVIEDKPIQATDRETGKEVYKMKYIFKDKDNREFEYVCPMHDKFGELHYFIRRMSQIPEGTEVTLEGKKSPTGSYIDIKWDGQAEPVEEEDY